MTAVDQTKWEPILQTSTNTDSNNATVGKIKSLNSNSNLKSNLDRTCLEISNLKMQAHNDENTNCKTNTRRS